MKCNNCGSDLEVINLQQGKLYHCKNCNYDYVTAQMLQENEIKDTTVSAMFFRVRRSQCVVDEKCNHCGNNLKKFNVNTGEKIIEILGCSDCKDFEFHNSGFFQLPKNNFIQNDNRNDEVDSELINDITNVVSEKEYGNSKPQTFLGRLLYYFMVPVKDGYLFGAEAWVNFVFAISLLLIFVLIYFRIWSPDLLRSNELFSLKNFVSGGFLMTFIHTNIFHLILLLYIILNFGEDIEMGLGKIHYVILVIMGSYFGSLFVNLFIGKNLHVVGASGAVFSLLGAFLIIQPKRLFFINPFLFRIIGVDLEMLRIPAFLFIINLLLINSIFYFFLKDANFVFIGHLGGFLFGLVYAIVLRYIFHIHGKLPEIEL